MDTTLSQKQIAGTLDRAAERSAKPATPKQVWFLAGLMLRQPDAEAEYQDWLLDTSGALSRDLASSLIDGYLQTAAEAA